MALPKMEKIDLQYLDQWFANVTGIINYDLQQIETAVPALNMVLTNLDVAPIQDLIDSLNELVDNINDAFDQIEDRLSSQGGK